MRILFFIGKGGTGKSTHAALTALHKAENGENTLLVSMDPAHNQSDIFQMSFGEKPVQVTHKLQVKELDLDFWMKKYLTEYQNKLKKNYSYLNVFQPKDHFKIIQYSPGIQEYALLYAFRAILTDCNSSVLVFDMPPTALTLKFFSLPQTTLIWLRHLTALRKSILEKKEIIANIKYRNKEKITDKALHKLIELSAEYQELQAVFSNKNTGIHLLVNSDELSFRESVRIEKQLHDLELSVEKIILNKAPANSADVENRLKISFKCNKIAVFPFFEKPPVGIETLKQYSLKNEDHQREFYE